MRVIKNNYKPYSYVFICKRCASELSITFQDIEVTRYSWRRPPLYEFTCPCCGKENSIPRDHEILKNY